MIAGLMRAHDVGAEAEALDRAGREILDEHIGLARQILDQLRARAAIFRLTVTDFLLALYSRK